jgi:hypothetical protein
MQPPSSTGGAPSDDGGGRGSLAERLDALVPPERIWIVAGIGAAVVFVLVLWLQYSGELTLPALPPKPRPADKQDLRRVDFTPTAYAGYVEKDVATYGLAPVSVEVMAAPFPYERSSRGVSLRPGGEPLDTGMLRLTALSRKEEIRDKRGASRSQHLILRIENKTDRPVAYRVETTVNVESATCDRKAVLVHNAIAIPAKGQVERSECFFRDNMELGVSSVEAMQLPDLGYIYASRIYPEHIGLPARTAAGHQPPKGALCTTIPQQLIVIGMQNGSMSWRDVVDFYARHRCETYDLPDGYRAVDKAGSQTLPAVLDAARSGSR